MKKVCKYLSFVPQSALTDAAVPIYNATNTAFDFTCDLPKLAQKLPLWTAGEIPSGSFVVAGYTVVSYKGKTANNGIQPHVGCNLLWVVVCGTPRDEKIQ
jgi:hypothetical protein